MKVNTFKYHELIGLKIVSMIMIFKPKSTHYGLKYKQFKCVDDTLSLDKPRIYLYKHSVHFVGYRQTVQTQVRRRRMRCLIRVSTVWLQNALLDLNINEKFRSTNLSNNNVLVKLILVVKFIHLKWVNQRSYIPFLPISV